MNHERIERVMTLFRKRWDHDYDEDMDPAFILAGDVPDYSHRLPSHYLVCVPLGTHGGVRFVYYSPRAFSVDDGEIKIHDGTLDGAKEGDVEFTVTVDTDGVVDSHILHEAGYDGPPLHTV